MCPSTEGVKPQNKIKIVLNTVESLISSVPGRAFIFILLTIW
ncbi:hypothetical protein E2C01_003219 [Portunus trituberculatus]|uniref:Uncharacterized protein n=1 Tax=Portunus trituberculatus TaxID=210409 RepID=A0A5B7CLM0_PORTR|nr:hypothetical protein [Portunus trituberculatus]